MASAEKLLQKMRNNPHDWRIEDLKTLAGRYAIDDSQQGTSHVTFRHPAATKVTSQLRFQLNLPTSSSSVERSEAMRKGAAS